MLIIPWLLKWQEHTLVFDVALHLGTLTAIVVYFFRDYISMIGNGLTKPKSDNGKLFWFLIIATIPAGIFGFLLEKKVETIFREQILLIALVMALFGIVIFVVDRFMKKENNLARVNVVQAIIIGLSQALALFPGVSRSGITMTAGMALGYKRDESAKFSFLLSGPVIFGAGLLSLLRNYKEVRSELVYFIVGFAVSAVVGFFVIHFLLNYLKKRTFIPFVIYRVAFAVLIAVVYFAR